MTLLTYDKRKSLEGFKAKRDYFKKIVDINDSCLSAIYDIHFYVKYNDSVEDADIWMVDEGRAVGLKENIENNKVIIDVAHDAKDESWVQYEKGAAALSLRMENIFLLVVMRYLRTKKKYGFLMIIT